MYNCNNHKTIFSHNKGVPVANSIHHSNSIYNYFKSLKLGLFLSDVYLNHLMIIMVSVFLRGYRGKTIEAFYVPKGTFVKLNPLIVHGTQYPVDKEDVHIVCMLPGRTFKNDMLSRRLETGEQIRITRGCKK